MRVFATILHNAVHSVVTVLHIMCDDEHNANIKLWTCLNVVKLYLMNASAERYFPLDNHVL